MRLHIDLEAEHLTAYGLSPEEARRRAAARFGGVTQAKEAARDLWGSHVSSELSRSFRLASRVLIRHRGFAVMMVLTLALTIAASTTAFSMIDALVNPTFIARNPDRLYVLKVILDSRIRTREHRRLIEESLGSGGGATFESYARSAPWHMTFRPAAAERGKLTRAASALSVSSNYFTTLGVSPLEGQLSPPRGGTGSEIAVISDRLRTELFADGERVVGQSLVVDGVPITVIGVVRRYEGVAPLVADLWVFEPAGVAFAIQHIVRLKPGASAAQLRSELEALSERAARKVGIPETRTAFVPSQLPIGLSAKTFHYALFGAGLSVLFIACLNLANLQLVRALGRSSEIATQAAVGAGRRNIIGQLLAENAVLVSIGLVLALALTLGAAALIRITVPRNIGTYVVAPDFNWRMVGFAIAGSALAVLLIGAIPALSVSRLDLNSLLKQRAGSGTSRRWSEGFGALVVVQIALAMPLVTGAVTLLTFLWAMTRPEAVTNQVGYDPTMMIRAQLHWTRTDETGPVSLGDVAPRQLRAIRSIPGVRDASLSASAQPPGQRVTVDDGSGEIREVETLLWAYRVVSPTYFRTRGRPIVRGSDFPDAGAGEDAVILDEITAQTLWPRANPLGRAVKLGSANSSAPWLRVRGIVGDRFTTEQREVRLAGGSERLTEAYRLISATDTMPANIYKRYEALVEVRADTNAPAVASTLRQHLSRLDGTRPPQVQLSSEYLGIPQRIAETRFVAALFAIFGALALGLAALGVYGIVAQRVADRRRDISIRLALGGTTRHIVLQVLRAQNVFALLGIAIGLTLTVMTNRLIGGVIGIDVDSVVLHAAVSAMLFICIVTAAIVPAIRAARVPPMEVLRAE